MEINTDFTRSVTAVVFREGKVLLGRHTYGNGKGLLIVPGGYIKNGEDPREAVKREYLEETGVVIEPEEVIGIRFRKNDWYVAFSANYISGEARSDEDENDLVVWMDIDEALQREDVPGLTKELILANKRKEKGFVEHDYDPLKEIGVLYGVDLESK